jgi:hypothetical protein
VTDWDGSISSGGAGLLFAFPGFPAFDALLPGAGGPCGPGGPWGPGGPGITGLIEVVEGVCAHASFIDPSPGSWVVISGHLGLDTNTIKIIAKDIRNVAEIIALITTFESKDYSLQNNYLSSLIN